MNSFNFTARFSAWMAAGILCLSAFAQSHVEPPTPPPPLGPLPLERDVFENVPTPPPDFVPVGPDGRPMPYKTETSTRHTRPELAGQNATSINSPLRGYTGGGDASAVGKIAPRQILPFGTKGERMGIAYLSGDFVPPLGEQIQPDLMLLAQSRMRQFNPASGNVQPAVYAMLLLNTRLDETLQQQFDAAGVKLFGFYPYSAYQALIPAQSLVQVAQMHQVRWIGQPNAVQKLDPELLPFMQKPSGERIGLFVTFFGPDSEGANRTALSAAGATVHQYYADLFTCYVEANALTVNQMLGMDAVLFIEPLRPAQGGHTQSMSAINADRLWGIRDGRPQGGRSIKLGVADSGMNTAHQDFNNLAGGMFGFNRTTEQYWWNDLHGHGTHVSGTFFGQGNAQARYRGVASGFQETNLLVYDLLHSKIFRSNNFAEGNSFAEGIEDMRGRGNNDIKRQIFNLSGGAAGNNYPGTDTWSRQVDGAFRENILPVFCAGNNGSGAGTIWTPAVAKGALAVGSVDDDGQTTVDQMVPSSSRGPAGDGRWKPDVCAYGRSIDSTSNTNNTGYLFGWSGTSMATPHVSGLAAGLMLAYNWPAWAIRTIIQATAINLGHSRNAQGLGKVDALLAHYAWNGGWWTWFWHNGSTGDLRYNDFTIPAGVTRLRVVFCYPDAPAAAGASRAIKNDLDIYLQTGTLTTDRSGNWSSLSSINNVEVIEVTNPPAGTYRLKVYTYAMVEGSTQDWAYTAHWTTGNQNPNVTLNLTAPVAVMPNTDFTINGTASAGSYVASSVFGRYDSPTGGISLNGMTFHRRSPSGGNETVYFAGASGMNQGSIGAGLSRQLDWSLRSSGTEGVRQVRYSTNSANGGSGSVTRDVIVDGTRPTNWQGLLPTPWTTSLTPTCSMQVRDVLAGLNTSGIYYWYFTPSSGIQGPFNCTTAATNGSTALERIFANSVPFNRENATADCQVYFRAYDRAGNFSDSGWQIVRIDATAPGNWQNFTPAAQVFGPTQTCSVQVRDLLSGLEVTLGYYRYSTDGGTTWSAWVLTPVSGASGTTAFQTITAVNVPFNLASSTQNKIEFAIRDVAGNWGYSSTYNVNITDSFTLTDGGASYTVSGTFGAANRHGTGGGMADFNASFGDQLFQDWWWYRIQGNNREFALSNLVEWSQPSASQMRLVYREPDDEGSTRLLRIELVYTLSSLGGGSASIRVVHRTTNTTGLTRILHLYPYFDFDLGVGNMVARVNPNTIRQTGSTGDCLNVWTSVDPNRWEIAAYDTTRWKLTNGQVDDLANAVSPFGPGDATAAFQFTRTLSAGQDFGGTLIKTINGHPNPGDVNGDGCVDDGDLLEVLFAFGNTGFGLPADLNCDNVVDDADLLIVLFNFGAGC